MSEKNVAKGSVVALTIVAMGLGWLIMLGVAALLDYAGVPAPQGATTLEDRLRTVESKVEALEAKVKMLEDDE